MNQQEFRNAMKWDLNFWIFDNAFILYKDLEVYEIETGESQYFESWESAMNYEHNGKSIAEYVDELENVNIHFDGGRGASGSSRNLFGGQGGDLESARMDPDFPARMNRLYNGNNMSREHTLETFRKQHANSKTEHLIAMDDNGFVSTYQHGGKHSVGFIPSQVAGKHVIHNHPSGSHFSKQDLMNLSTTKQKGITATGSKATYTVTKTSKFDAKGFSKALETAKTTDSDYDRALDRFLKRNSSRYGYTYSVTRY